MRTLTFGLYPQLSIFTQQQHQAEVTQNISTAESPGHWASPEQTPIIFRMPKHTKRMTKNFPIIFLIAVMVTAIGCNQSQKKEY